MRRVGIVGAGTMSRVHADAWGHTGAHLAGVYSSRLEAAARVAGLYRATAFASLESLLDAVDIVDICAPTDTHREYVLAAARAGKHVLCEKPIALTLEDATEMIGAVESNGVRLFVAHILRFFPEYAAARRLVSEGAIGNLGVISLSRAIPHPGAGPRKWYAAEDRSGGVVTDLMVHDFDYARWLAGDVARVYCRRYTSDSADYALVTLRLAGGAIAHIEGSWAYLTGSFHTAFDIAGGDGLLTYDSDRSSPLRLRFREQEGGKPGVVLPTTPLLGEDNPYVKEVQHVLSCLDSGEEFLVTARDAVAALQIALAARQSAATGQPVALEPVATRLASSEGERL